MAKKRCLSENFGIVDRRQVLSPSKWSYRVYRFYRKTFTVQMRWVFVGVFVVVCGVAFLFSPSLTLERSVPAGFPSLSVCTQVSEENELKDSTPLFLPTRWNVYGNSFGGQGEVGKGEDLAFAGKFFLDMEESRISRSPKVLGQRENFERAEESVFEGSKRWELTSSFGERRLFDAAAPITSGVRMSVADSGRNKNIFRGNIPLEGMYDAKMLWAPIEIDCYGEAAFRHFTITRSSGSTEIDKRVLAFVRMWASKHLRSQGKFHFCIGR